MSEILNVGGHQGLERDQLAYYHLFRDRPSMINVWPRRRAPGYPGVASSALQRES